MLSATLNLSRNVIGQASRLATVTLENQIMSKHKLTYLEMYPEALPTDQPSDLAIVAGAAALVAALGFVLIVLFSL